MKLKTYFSSEKGNVGLIFAFSVLPILFCVGAAIDHSRLTAHAMKLQNASDTAALAAALAYVEDGKKEMEKVGKETLQFNAYEGSNVNPDKVKIKKTDRNTVSVSTKGSIDAKFVQIFGYPKLDFNVTSEASLNSPRGLELVVAFDSTNSMNFDSRWDNAMSTIESTMTDMKSLTGKKDFYATLVPFGDRVNIGNKRSKWLSGKKPNKWTGCVEPREFSEGSFGWALDDKSPETRPFEASISGVTGGLDKISCPSVSITGPTNKPDDITKAAKKMTHGGTGRFDAGMAWAWRVLSPEWAEKWNEKNYPALNTDERSKKIIFVSDGNSNAYRKEMSAEDSWGHNQGSVVAFDHLVELCRKIKSDGIEIYMLKIDGNPHADSYFQQCASSVDHYYKVDGAEDISIAFTDILDELYAELRLVD